MSKIKVYSRFDRPEVKGITCTAEEGKTQQSFKEECDINTIVETYSKTGLWGNSMRPATSQPMFGDFAEVPDFVESQRIIAQAKEQFEALPARLRKRFNHDPAELLRFVGDEANAEEAILLGIATKKEPPKEAVAPNDGKG
ncbi:MAG: internal scaffolding protein [Microviridae sp.]|nr:MAG: internal scaffolding protein [Microviridae sp.]